MSLDVGKRVHGTWQAYANGCRRCEPCRAAWASYMRARNHRLGISRPMTELRFYAPPYGRRGFSTLGEQILDVAVARTGRSWRDIVDKLVRDYGATMTFPEASATVN